MQNKILFLAVVVVGIMILGMWWKVRTSTIAAFDSGSQVITLTTSPNPLRPGPATFIIEVKDENGKPVDNAIVSFDLNMTTMNMGIQKGNAKPQGSGKYVATGQISMLGPWRLATKITLPDKSVVNKDFVVSVR